MMAIAVLTTDNVIILIYMTNTPRIPVQVAVVVGLGRGSSGGSSVCGGV